MSNSHPAWPIRLCVVNPFGYELFDPGARASKLFGGAEVQLYYLATALAKDPRFDVSMIVDEPAQGVAPVCEEVRVIGVRVIAPRLARLRDRIPVPATTYLAAMRRANADIYLQRGGAVLTGDVAAYCLFNRRKFVFMAAHDWDCDRSHQRGLQYLSGTYYLAGLRSASLVFAQSILQRDLLREQHGITSLIQRTVYPATKCCDVRRDHVLWVGRCLDWKRPMAFLDLAVTLPDTLFVMACPLYDGPRDLYDRVRRRAAKIPNVRFLDFVPFVETENLFRRAIAFVNTSTVEGFPNTFVQAARAGTPVLSLVVNPDGIIEKAGIGACAAGAPTLLAKQLADLLDQPHMWRKYSANASAYFRHEHDLDTQVLPFAEALCMVGYLASRKSR